MPEDRPLTAGFAVRLAEAAGIGDPTGAGASWYEPVVSDSLPEHISVHGLRGGFLVFNFANNTAYCGGNLPKQGSFSDPEYWEASQKRNEIALKRAKFMNAFLATLWAGGQDTGHGFLPQPSVHIGNYMFADNQTGRWDLTGPTEHGGDRWIPAEAISKSAHYMNSVYNYYEADAVEILSLLQAATAHYANHEFSSCLVVGWSVVEALLTRLWKEYLDNADVKNGGHTAFNADRRSQLNGRDFSASVISQMLSLAGIIDDDRLQAMNRARRARNDFVHDLKSVSSDIAFAPVSLASSIIAQNASCRFRMGGSFSWHS